MRWLFLLKILPIIFLLINITKSDISVIQVNNTYTNYSDILFEYYDDSQGFKIASELCLERKSFKCYGKVNFYFTITMKTYILQNHKNYTKSIIIGLPCENIR